MRNNYLELISLVERLHRYVLELTKLELDSLAIHDINGVQAMILSNIGDAEMTVGELTLRGCYMGTNVSYNVKKLVENRYLLFYLPIVWIGFPPQWVYGMVSASLTYQFFVHTELIPHVGWLETLINTPSAHRVHHASNPQYLDKNFGGILLVWDHLFGTYQAEQPNVAIRYGLTHPRSRPDNPFFIAYQGLWEIAKGWASAGTARQRLARVFGPP